jgi:ribose 5-phosphate isomerase A
MDAITRAKKAAAIKAVDKHVHSDQIIGIGSGSTIKFAVEYLGKKYREKEIVKIICVPSSFQSRKLILDNNLPLGEINQYPNLDIDIDGADEIDAKLNLIKGGGGCHLQEKIVASCAQDLIIIADFRKISHKLGEQWKKGIPLEVSPFAYIPVMDHLKALGGKPHLRMAQAKAGPVVTDNGNLIIDVDFGIIKNPGVLNQLILQIPGILETGFFIQMVKYVYIGESDGSVSKRSPTD